MTEERRILIDNSAWSRLATHEVVRKALEALVHSSSPSDVLVCPPVAAEYAFSARSPNDHDLIVAQLRAFTECFRAPQVDDVLRLQNALWHAGLKRAVGTTDLMIASYALLNEATVVHYDSDFEFIARVEPSFRHEWVVPRGTF